MVKMESMRDFYIWFHGFGCGFSFCMSQNKNQLKYDFDPFILTDNLSMMLRMAHHEIFPELSIDEQTKKFNGIDTNEKLIQVVQTSYDALFRGNV